MAHNLVYSDKNQKCFLTISMLYQKTFKLMRFELQLNNQMNPSSPKFSSYHQSRELPYQSRDTQVLRSIDIKHDSSSQSKPSQVDHLMMRLLLLSIEIDRKDAIIRQLLMATNNNHYEIQMEELSMKCQKYEMEIKTLNQTIHMLKENISVIQSTKNKQVFNSINHQFNEQLQNKVYSLEGKIRRLQDEKITAEEQLKQFKLNQSMIQYKLIQKQQNEKGRVRELQSQIITERNKAESQRKTAMEKTIIIQDLKNRLIQFQTNEKMIIHQYEQKLRSFQNEFAYHQNLKKSQIVSTQQKISASAQEINRLHEEIKYLKQNLDNQRENGRTKEKEYTKVLTQNKMIENKCIRLQGELKEVGVRFENKSNEIKLRDREIGEKEAAIKKMHSQAEEVKHYFTHQHQQIEIYTTEINRLKEELSQLYHQNDTNKNQLRKLKRKPISNTVLCEACRIKETGSSTLITSQKSIKALNIEDIIQQTQQLFRSNRKMQNLITKHESVSSSTIHLYNGNTYQI